MKHLPVQDVWGKIVRSAASFRTWRNIEGRENLRRDAGWGNVVPKFRRGIFESSIVSIEKLWQKFLQNSWSSNERIVKIPSNSFSVDPISIRIEEDLSENEEKIDRVQDLTQEVNIVGEVGESKVTNKSTSNGQLDIGQQMSSSEKNISPDEVSHEVSTTEESLCSNAETSVREDKNCVTGEEDQDNVPVSVSNAGHDYTLISWVSKILDFSD